MLPGVLWHHERWDGGGYPDGLKGEDIPLIARVLDNMEDETVLQQVRAEVRELTQAYPVPGISDRIGAAV